MSELLKTPKLAILFFLAVNFDPDWEFNLQCADLFQETNFCRHGRQCSFNRRLVLTG